MRAFYKLCAKLAVALIGIGIILTIIGIMNGGNSNRLNIGPVHLKPKLNFKNSELSSTSNTEDKEVVISEVEDIHSIDIDIDYGDVVIQEGKAFQIYTNSNNSKDLKVKQENGIWKIESDKEYNFNIFGISIGNHGISHHNSGRITIVIPKDYRAKKIKMELGAGKVTADQLRADNISLDVGAGTLRVDTLYAYESANMIVGAGEIYVDIIEAMNADIDCGVGSIKVDNGSLAGKNRIQCGVGNVELRLSGNQEDYNYYVDSGIGNVIINEEKYSMTSSTKRTNDSSTSEFDIECGVGNVNIQIRE